MEEKECGGRRGVNKGSAAVAENGPIQTGSPQCLLMGAVWRGKTEVTTPWLSLIPHPPRGPAQRPSGMS